MSAFKVGQRVRIIYLPPTAPKYAKPMWGRTGTINAIPSHNPGSDCDVAIDGVSGIAMGFMFDSFYAKFFQLAPLTDPGADAFIESVKQLKPLNGPVTV